MEIDFCNQIYCSDCLEKLKEFPDNSIDLIVTSPPYADNRKNTYAVLNPMIM